jgi:hypothetical protein
MGCSDQPVIDTDQKPKVKIGKLGFGEISHFRDLADSHSDMFGHTTPLYMYPTGLALEAAQQGERRQTCAF